MLTATNPLSTKKKKKKRAKKKRRVKKAGSKRSDRRPKTIERAARFKGDRFCGGFTLRIEHFLQRQKARDCSLAEQRAKHSYPHLSHHQGCG